MTQNQIPFGLMPVLDAALELPRTSLPLKSVRYQFVARGGFAEVQITQVYCQENARALDCEYLFPLPADGAVHRCEATINGRVIRAVIEEREAARKLVAEKKAEGFRTALVESERSNLFTLSLGNLQPQDLIEVTLAYLQPLRRVAGQISLDLPLCPGIRYVPGNALLRSNRGFGIADDTDQVPDASRITPPRIDKGHPDAAFIDLHGQLEDEFVDGDVASPTHKLTARKTGGTLHLSLAKGGETPDRDLALRWKEREPNTTALRGWISQDRGNKYALLELRAPASVVPCESVAQDYYFLVDRSGSMQGAKWRKATQALLGCVGILGPKDRVAVTLFESAFTDFDAEPVPPASLLADPRFLQLASLGTDGGTEMEPALSHVLGLVDRFSKGRSAVLILITDAQIANEQELVALMRTHPNLPMHCFGIDTTLNDSLLLDLVRQQGGTFHALQPNEDVAAIVTSMACTLRQPVLVNLQAPVGWELAARTIPNLYAGQVHHVSMRTAGTSESGAFNIRAIDHNNSAVSLNVEFKSEQGSIPHLLWCKERIVALAAADEKQAAIALSKDANLLCPFTAFVAWDESQKVAVASDRLTQPSLFHAGSDLKASMQSGLRQLPVAYCMDETEDISLWKTVYRRSPALAKPRQPENPAHFPQLAKDVLKPKPSPDTHAPVIDPETALRIDSWFKTFQKTKGGEHDDLLDILGLYGICDASLVSCVQDGHFAPTPLPGAFNVGIIKGKLISPKRREALDGGARPTTAELKLFKKHYATWVFYQDSGWYHFYVWQIPALGRFYYLLSLHGDGGMLDKSYGPYKTVNDLWRSNPGTRKT